MNEVFLNLGHILLISMPIDIQRSSDRGTTKTTWLNSRHSFSFGNYWNPNQMHFGLLRVLNDDWIEPGTGFGMHGHDNMEIVTIVLEGALQHTDTMGNSESLGEGEIQRMSAGRGLRHSETNPSKKDRAHLLQLWVDPKEVDVAPSYEQRKITPGKNKLDVAVSPDGPVFINQDAYFLLGNIEKGKEVSYKPKMGNGVYVFVISGDVHIHTYNLKEGDAASIKDATEIKLKTSEGTHALLIEVPME